MDKCGRFIPVDVLPRSFVVNLGDIAKAWSNGRLCNVQHRVQCKEAKVRISIASFLVGPKGTVVETPAELISSENPWQYVSFTFEEYRKLRFTTKLQAGQALELVRAIVLNPKYLVILKSCIRRPLRDNKLALI